MAGQCLDKLPHSCGTRKGLQVFDRSDGTVDGWCFSCKTFVRHPYGEKRESKDLPKPQQKTEKEIQEEIAEIHGYPVVDIPQKKLRKNVLEEFNVKVALSEEDGKTPVMICYPYTKDGKLKGYRVKTLDGDKKIWSVGDLKDVDFFGWEQAISQGAKRLIITEGEDDAISWRRVLQLHSREDFRDFTAVVSLPNGAGSAKKSIMSRLKDIQKNFDDVILSFDMDEPGQEAAKEVSMFCPSFKIISTPSKDANQCVIDGRGKALFSSLFKTETMKNTRIVFGDDLHEAAKTPARWGELTWPWKHINDETRGIRYGDTIYLGAGVKMGKSEMVNALAAHFIKEHDIKVFMAKPEEENKKSYKMLASKVVGRIFHDPKVEFDEEAYDRAGEVLKGHVSMVNLWQHLGWSSLKEDIHAAINWGAKAIFIDPITNLTAGTDSAEANTKLEEIAQELSIIARDFNVVIFIFCHLKAHDGNISREARDKKYKDGITIGLGNCGHEWGGDVYSHQFAGSRAMMRSCNMMVGLEGNKDPELDKNTRNIRHIKILEDREFGITGIFPLWWDEKTSLFKEI